jgi:hypothetical protein
MSSVIDANHLVTIIEHYDSCLDISIGGTGTATGGPASTELAVNASGSSQGTTASLDPSPSETTATVKPASKSRTHRQK